MKTLLVILLLVFCGSVSAADVNLPPPVEESLKSRVFVKVFPENFPNQENYGSGFVISPEGHVATCYHLIYAFLGHFQKEGLVIEVRNFKGESALFGIHAENYKNDLIVLKVKNPKDAAKFNRPAKIADAFPRDGSEVYASGWTFGGKFSATLKSVTLGRVDEFPYNGFIINQVVILDRQIIPGFSGGPVFNSKGEVVGMNLATGLGISVILPLEALKEVKEALK